MKITKTQGMNNVYGLFMTRSNLFTDVQRYFVNRGWTVKKLMKNFLNDLQKLLLSSLKTFITKTFIAFIEQIFMKIQKGF